MAHNRYPSLDGLPRIDFVPPFFVASVVSTSFLEKKNDERAANVVCGRWDVHVCKPGKRKGSEPWLPE